MINSQVNSGFLSMHEYIFIIIYVIILYYLLFFIFIFFIYILASRDNNYVSREKFDAFSAFCHRLIIR